jgi:hypothetical protein
MCELSRWYQIAAECQCLRPALTYAMFGTYAALIEISAFVIFGTVKPTVFAEDWKSLRRRVSDFMSFHAQLIDTLGSEPICSLGAST